MSVLRSDANPRSEVFAANMAAMRALVDDLRARVAAVEQGGGAAARQRHVGRGKLLPRERVAGLIDPGSRFLELSQLAAHGITAMRCPEPASSPASGASPAGNASSLPTMRR